MFFIFLSSIVSGVRTRVPLRTELFSEITVNRARMPNAEFEFLDVSSALVDRARLF